MEKLVLIVLILFVFDAVKAREQRHHPKFPDMKKVETCSMQHETLNNEIIDEASCRDPKDVFVELQPLAAHVQVMPGAVWVKRCVGLCTESGSSCVATEKRQRQIPVRTRDAKTGRESCSWYSIEEHTKCGCCSMSEEDCRSPQIFNHPEPEFKVEST